MKKESEPINGVPVVSEISKPGTITDPVSGFNKTNKLTEASISSAIYIVAAPTMLHMFLETAYHLIDAVWIGMLGSVALAAVASASFYLWMIFSACTMVEIGVNSLVARCYGAKDLVSLKKTAISGIKFGIILSLFLAAAGIPAIDAVFSLMGLAPDVTDQAKCFLIPVFLGLPVYILS